MKVAVVIPMHDAERFVAATLASVLCQTRPPDEIIVVDDRSSDGGPDVVAHLADRSCVPIRLVRSDAGNAATARNLGALATDADRLMFVDADDLLSADTLASLLAVVGDGDVGLAPWQRLRHRPDGLVAEPPSCRPRLAGEDPLAAWLAGWYHPPCSVLWSREAFERAGRWEEGSTVNDDGDLMLRALAVGVELVTTREGMAFYRRSPAGHLSLSDRAHTHEGLRSRLEVVRKIDAWLRDLGGMTAERRRGIRLALAAIATDADGEHPAIARRADRLAFGRLPARPLLRRIVRGLDGRRLPPPPPVRTEPSLPDPAHAQFEHTHGSTPRPRPAEFRAESVERPTVSVIIPTFDRADTIVAAIDSALAQTLDDLEVIVVDDGSRDDTETVVTAHPDPRVRYLRQPANRGVAAARNRGMRESRGEFIAFLDSDDVWMPEKLTAQIALFERADRQRASGTDDHQLGLVYGGVEHRTNAGTSIDIATERGWLHPELLERNVVHGGGSNVVIPRSVVARVGFFDEDLPAIEDWDYWLRIGRHHRIDCVAEPVMRYEDAATDTRRSRAARANRIARRAFHRRHRREMRSAGVEHRYLAESARRALTDDRREARALAGRAVATAPHRAESWRVLARGWLPSAARDRIRRPRPAGPRKVLLYSFVPGTESGGVQQSCRALDERLRARGYATEMLWSDDDDPRHRLHLTLPDLDGWRTAVRSTASSIAASCRLGLLLARSRPDVVHLHFVTGGVVHFLLWRRLLGYRIVATAHGSDVLRTPPGRAYSLGRRALHRVDVLTAVSGRIRRELTDGGFNEQRVEIVPNGIDVGSWAREVRRPPDPPRLVTVGRLTPVKGHDILLDAFADVVREHPSVRLTIVGDGELRAALTERIERDFTIGAVDGGVELVGFLDQDAIRRVFARSSVFVLPSRSEGMPLALIEAMAAGLPPVATDVGDVADVVAHAGFVVPAEDSDVLAKAILALLDDPELADRLGDEARRRSHDFALETTIDRYVACYDAALETP